MDRRTQLAFLLIVVLMISNVLIMRRMAPERPDTGAAADSTAAAPDAAAPQAVRSEETAAAPSTATAPAPATTAPFPVASGDEEDLVVETPLYRARIARAGAVITEISLHEYELAGGGTVNLVPEGSVDGSGDVALGLVLNTPEGQIDLTRARFDVSGGGAPSGTLRLAEGSGPRTITLRSAAEGGGAVLKHFTFDPERYEIRVDLELERGDGLAQIEGYRLLWTHSLESTEGNQKDDWASFQLAASAGRQVTRQGLRGGFFGGGASEDKSTSVVGELDWASMKSKYFVVAVIPESQKSGKATLIGNPKTHRMRFEIDQPFPWRGGPRETYRVYAGPIVYDRLANLGVGLEAVVELGWSWIRPFSRLVLTFMRFLHNFISNYGIIIIIVSVLSKLVFWPLSEKSFRSMREMQSVQPLMQEIRNRYKDDPQEMNRQVMALYKRRGVNPVGGCMPLVVQMPIFVALYAVLRSDIELRNAPFMLWIDNLAAPDVLFTMPFRLPGLGSDFSLLPLLMGAAMIWQSKMGSPMSMSGPGAQQQAMMKWLMPIVFIFIFYKMPSGLVLYWLVNTVLSVSQQLLINRKFAEAPAASTAALPKLQDQGRKDHGAPDRVDRPQRGRSARKGARRVGGKAR